MYPDERRRPRFAVDDDAPGGSAGPGVPGAPVGPGMPGAAAGPGIPGTPVALSDADAAIRFFEDQVGPLSAGQARRLALLTMSYGEAAVVRALAEVVILQMNEAVLALTRDRLLARHPLH